MGIRYGKSRISLIPAGSNPLIGSSRIKKAGLLIRAMANPSRCFIPIEKCLTFFFPVDSSPTSLYGLIGKNGAGKTTFMRMVLGLASPDSGQMELFGKTDLEQQRKHIGSLIEEPGRYPSMSARAFRKSL